MAATFALVLSVGLAAVPALVVEIMEVEVDRFRKKRASADCPIRSVACFLFTMPLVMDDAKCQVELLKCCMVDIRNDTIDEIVEVSETLGPGVEIVKSRDAVNIGHIFLHSVKQRIG